jgi:hypothetical protein
MSGAIPPLPNTPSWHGAYLSTGTTLPFLLSLLTFYRASLFSFTVFKLALCLTQHHALKMFEGVKVQLATRVLNLGARWR